MFCADLFSTFLRFVIVVVTASVVTVSVVAFGSAHNGPHKVSWQLSVSVIHPLLPLRCCLHTLPGLESRLECRSTKNCILCGKLRGMEQLALLVNCWWPILNRAVPGDCLPPSLLSRAVPGDCLPPSLLSRAVPGDCLLPFLLEPSQVTVSHHPSSAEPSQVTVPPQPSRPR